jgi:hypothetical protein
MKEKDQAQQRACFFEQKPLSGGDYLGLLNAGRLNNEE